MRRCSAVQCYHEQQPDFFVSPNDPGIPGVIIPGSTGGSVFISLSLVSTCSDTAHTFVNTCSDTTHTFVFTCSDTTHTFVNTCSDTIC